MSQSTATNFTVRHDQVQQKFALEIEGRESHLTYHKQGSTLDFNHTFVATEDRGKGIAEKLVLAGFNYAKANNFQVIPSCSYVDTFVRRHSEWQDLCR